LALFFIMVHSDFKHASSYDNSHIKNMHLKICYQNSVKWQICKCQQINEKMVMNID